MVLRLALALLLSSNLLAGCQSKQGQQPNVVVLTATDYDFQTPDTLAAGWTTFRLVNNGGQPHMAQLVRLDPGMTVEDFLAAYGEAFQTQGRRPEWARRLGGPTVTVPQQTNNATLYLEPGDYVWICLYNIPDGIPHVVSHGMAEPFVVMQTEPTPSSEAAPKADVVMQLMDYAFGLDTPLTAGRHMIRVQNAGSEPHEVSVLKLADGKTVEDVQAWMQNPGQAPLEDIVSVAGGVTSFVPGAEIYFEVDLTPGEYVLLCVVTAPDGRSHMEHGMIQQIRVD